MLRIGIDYILGFQPTFTGMIVDPKIPSEWAGFTAKRKFRGKILSLTVTNHSSINQMTVNGEVVDGKFINLAKYESEEIEIAIHL